MNVEKTIKNLELRHFKVQHFASGKEAVEYICAATHNTTVGIGGSLTVKQLGLYDELIKDNQVFWHWVTPGFDTLNKQPSAKVFISSANAISEDGEIVNIDGRGNRLAGLVYGFGEKKVYIVAGTNKIAEDLNAAITRARNVAAPANIQRFPYNTPCKIDGKCHDCRSPQRACNALLVLWGPMMETEIEVILIDEELGL